MFSLTVGVVSAFRSCSPCLWPLSLTIWSWMKTWRSWSRFEVSFANVFYRGDTDVYSDRCRCVSERSTRFCGGRWLMCLSRGGHVWREVKQNYHTLGLERAWTGNRRHTHKNLNWLNVCYLCGCMVFCNCLTIHLFIYSFIYIYDYYTSSLINTLEKIPCQDQLRCKDTITVDLCESRTNNKFVIRLCIDVSNGTFTKILFNFHGWWTTQWNVLFCFGSCRNMYVGWSNELIAIFS